MPSYCLQRVMQLNARHETLDLSPAFACYISKLPGKTIAASGKDVRSKWPSVSTCGTV